MKLTLGIDLGSTAIKLVFVNDGELIWKKVEPTAPQQEKIVRTMIQQGLDALSLTEDNIEKIHVTGYGKKLIANADKAVDEISANALGVYLLSGKKARSIINIGGQDVKYIKLAENGKVSDFRMNDKCAAGTGRFFEMAARILDTPITDFEALSKESKNSVNLNSTCVVFAESEIVSLLANGVKKQDIINALHYSVAKRISNLTGDQDIEEDLYIDGGSAMNKGLVAAIEDELCYDAEVLPHPQFTVAYGAACCV